jgi:DNA-binding CsgD family transcriptional regulator
MKHCNDLAYLRQLCCLGLGREIVMPEFLKAVRTLIPSNNNFYAGTNGDGVPNYYLTAMSAPNYLETAADVLPKFFTPERRSVVYQQFNQYPAITSHVLLDKQFFQTDFYNLMWQPCDQYHFILAPVIVNKRIAGLFFLFRPLADPSFSVNEQKLCIQLLPYIAHALQEPKFIDTDYVNSGQSGLTITDKWGAIVHTSPSAERLLSRAMQANSNGDNPYKHTRLPQPLVKLCRNLDILFNGEDAPPPALTHTNSAGRFIFRAYWLDGLNNSANDLIGVTIEHQEPLTLKITRNLQTQPLSATQKEVTLLLAKGHSNEKIGQQLHIKTTTVKDHISKIYTKLNISHRKELLPRLLSETYNDSSFKVNTQYH